MLAMTRYGFAMRLIQCIFYEKERSEHMIAKFVELKDVVIEYEDEHGRFVEPTHYDTCSVDLGRDLLEIDGVSGRPYLYDVGIARIYLPNKYKDVKSMDELKDRLIKDGIDADYSNLPPDPDGFEYIRKEH